MMETEKLLRLMPSSMFLRFAMVGVAGFVVDATSLALYMRLGCGFLTGRAFSYLTAATFTWAVNRSWTFQPTDQPLLRQWFRFITANGVGGAINYAVSAVMALSMPELIGPYPFLAVGAGSLSGLLVNFTLSKHFVFRN